MRVRDGVALQDKDGPKALDEFCRDLCEDVRQNKIDPVSGRDARSSSRRR